MGLWIVIDLHFKYTTDAKHAGAHVRSCSQRFLQGWWITSSLRRSFFCLTSWSTGRFKGFNNGGHSETKGQGSAVRKQTQRQKEELTSHQRKFICNMSQHACVVQECFLFLGNIASGCFRFSQSTRCIQLWFAGHIRRRNWTPGAICASQEQAGCGYRAACPSCERVRVLWQTSAPGNPALHYTSSDFHTHFAVSVLIWFTSHFPST